MSQKLSWADVERLNAKVFAGRFKKELPDAPAQGVPGDDKPPCQETRTKNKTRVKSRSEEVLSERELQKQVGQLLRLKGVWFDVQRMDKKTRGVVGRPDFLFAWQGRPCAFEFKVGYNQLSSEQSATIETMKAQGWRVAVIRSTQEAFEFLKGDYV